VKIGQSYTVTRVADRKSSARGVAAREGTLPPEEIAGKFFMVSDVFRGYERSGGGCAG
jgi:hypothetical protein